MEKELTMKERLKNFQEKIKPLCKTSLSNDAELIWFYQQNLDDKNELKNLYKYFFNKDLGGCSSCFVDATAQILAIDLKSDLANKKDCGFSLYAGTLLQDTANYDNSKNVTNNNITRENAIWHLSQDATKIKYFQKVPENFFETSCGSVETKDIDEKDASVILNASYTDGEIPMIEKGFYLCDKKDKEDEEKWDKIVVRSNGKDFSKVIKGLLDGMTYKVKAFAGNGLKEVVGEVKEFIFTTK